MHTSDKQNDPDDIKLPEDGNSELLESWGIGKLTKKRPMGRLVPTELFERRPVRLHALRL